METKQNEFDYIFYFQDINIYIQDTKSSHYKWKLHIINEKNIVKDYFSGDHALAEGTEEEDFVTVLPCVVHRFGWILNMFNTCVQRAVHCGAQIWNNFRPVFELVL